MFVNENALFNVKLKRNGQNTSKLLQNRSENDNILLLDFITIKLVFG